MNKYQFVFIQSLTKILFILFYLFLFYFKSIILILFTANKTVHNKFYKNFNVLDNFEFL